MFWWQEDFSEVGETVAGRGLKEHPSPLGKVESLPGTLPTASVAWGKHGVRGRG